MAPRSIPILRTLRKVFLLLFTWFAVIEVVLRLIGDLPIWPEGFYIRDSDIGFTIRPGEETGGQRFKDAPHPANPQRRILFVGDSFGFGSYAANETVASFVEAGLNQNPNVRVAVYNRSLPSAGPSNYVRLVAREAPLVRADTVVVMLYLGNDIEQSSPRQETRLWMGNVGTLNKPLSFGLLAQDFVTYTVAAKIVRLMQSRLDGEPGSLAPTPGEVGRMDGGMSQAEFRRVEFRQMEVLRRNKRAFFELAFKGIDQRLGQIQEAAGGRELMVVLAPMRSQLDRPWREQVLAFYRESEATFDVSLPNREIANIAARRHIRLLDLTAAFSVPHPEELFNRGDTHWNLEGNRLAARSIVAALIDQ